MSRTTKIAVVLLAGVMVFAAGCGSKKASTPKEALKNMQKALVDGDSEAFVACFDASENQKKVLGSMCDSISTMSKFSKAMKKAYGKDAVKSKDDDLADEKWLEDITVKIDGDKATATSKERAKPMHLVKKDGEWKILASDLLPEDQMKDVDQAMKMFKAMAKAYEDVMPKIGKEGYTAQKINEEAGKALMDAMMGTPKE